MRSGSLNKHIEIQQSACSQDTTGASVKNWIPFHLTWASIWPLSASEHLSMGKLQGEISHKVRIRYLTGVTSAMRVVFNGRILDIVSPPINKDERNEQLEILCKELV